MVLRFGIFLIGHDFDSQANPGQADLDQALDRLRTERAGKGPRATSMAWYAPQRQRFWEQDRRRLVYSNALAINALSSFLASSPTRVGIKNRRIGTHSPLTKKISRARGAAPCLSQSSSAVFGTARSRGIRPTRPHVPTTRQPLRSTCPPPATGGFRRNSGQRGSRSRSSGATG